MTTQQYVISPTRIRQARLQAGLTLQRASQEIPAAQGGLVNYETGRSKPGADLIGRMAAAYGVTPGYFFIHTPEADTASTGCGPTRDTDQPASRAVSPVHTGV